jgi:hypothetical protein
MASAQRTMPVRCKRGGAARRAGGNQPLEHAPGLDHVEVVGQVDGRHQQPAARLLHDEADGHHAHQRLAHRRAAQARALGQVGLDDLAAGLELHGGQQRLDGVVGHVGGAALGRGRGAVFGAAMVSSADAASLSGLDRATASRPPVWRCGPATAAGAAPAASSRRETAPRRRTRGPGRRPCRSGGAAWRRSSRCMPRAPTAARLRSGTPACRAEASGLDVGGQREAAVQLVGESVPAGAFALVRLWRRARCRRPQAGDGALGQRAFAAAEAGAFAGRVDAGDAGGLHASTASACAA